MKIKIAPSILSADFSSLGQEVKDITKAGADYIHIDVMDGSFVPNITIGPDVIKSIRNKSDLIFDTHLMINNPENHIEEFAKAGSDIITIHEESTIYLDRAISLIKSFGKKVGIALIPSNNEDCIDSVIDKIDMILVMTVNPGFGGQKFLDSQIKKISNIRKKINESGRNIDLQVDGGINADTAKIVIDAGANILVSGSYIFNSDDYKSRIEELCRM